MAELVLTRHARLAVDRRGISRGELRGCVYHPDEVTRGRHFGTERRQKRSGTGVLVAIVRPTRRKLLLVTAYRAGEDDPSTL